MPDAVLGAENVMASEWTRGRAPCGDGGPGPEPLSSCPAAFSVSRALTDVTS